jgi:hypothetical protein
VAGCCKHGDEPAGSGATELAIMEAQGPILGPEATNQKCFPFFLFPSQEMYLTYALGKRR